MRSDARTNRDWMLVTVEAVLGEFGNTGSTEEVARRSCEALRSTRAS